MCEAMDLEEINQTCKWNRVNCPKKPYRNRAIAERKLRQLQDAGRREANCYLCPYCSRWHLSSIAEWVPELERDRGQGEEAADLHMCMKGEPS